MSFSCFSISKAEQIVPKKLLPDQHFFLHRTRPRTPTMYVWIKLLNVYKVGYRNLQYKKRCLSAVYTRFHPTSIFWKIGQNLWQFRSQNCNIQSFLFSLQSISLIMGSILSYGRKNIIRKSYFWVISAQKFTDIPLRLKSALFYVFIFCSIVIWGR